MCPSHDSDVLASLPGYPINLFREGDLPGVPGEEGPEGWLFLSLNNLRPKMTLSCSREDVSLPLTRVCWPHQAGVTMVPGPSCRPLSQPGGLKLDCTPAELAQFSFTLTLGVSPFRVSGKEVGEVLLGSPTFLGLWKPSSVSKQIQLLPPVPSIKGSFETGFTFLDSCLYEATQ